MSVLLPIIAALTQVALTAPPIPPRVVLPLPPTDWTGLDELRFQRRWSNGPELSSFVRDEVTAGRCAAAMKAEGGYSLRIELAVLVSASGQVRRIIPRAIQCVTVEQFASGLVSRMARDNLAATGLPADTWFRTSLTFAWPA